MDYQLFFHGNSVVYIDFKHFCENLIDHLCENQCFLSKDCWKHSWIHWKWQGFSEKLAGSQWNISLFSLESVVYIDFKHSCDNFINYYWENQSFLGKQCLKLS